MNVTHRTVRPSDQVQVLSTEHTGANTPETHTAPLSVSSGRSLSLKVSKSAAFPCCGFSSSTLITQRVILAEKATPHTAAGTEKLIKPPRPRSGSGFKSGSTERARAVLNSRQVLRLFFVAEHHSITTEDAKASDGHSLSSWQRRQWNLN